jgi:hypothetical protein
VADDSRYPVRSRADARVARAVEAVRKLDRHEQRRAFLALPEYLGAPAERENVRARIARQRVEVMEDFGLVAAHLGLADGRAPTRTQCEGLVEELGLRYPASAVAELWNGRWRQAAFEFTGRASYESEEMRALRVRAEQAAVPIPNAESSTHWDVCANG